VTLFDLDGTLLPIDTDHAFNEHVLRLGWADPEQFRVRNDAFFDDYQRQRLDIHAYVAFATAPWRHRDGREVSQAREAFVQSIVQPAVLPCALELVQRHQQAGDLVAIVTATNDFVTRPVADLFGIDHLLATELERDASGRPNGAIRGVPSFREGKVARVEQWLSQQGIDRASLECCTFYSDSVNDLPLLEWVSHPVATNPGPALEQHALMRGWPVLKLFHP
jgi:HAD superfamily hydrolase (TIGR01490 family)